MQKALKIKVCGMAQAANIAAIANLYPDFLGFIFYDQSPRCVTDVTAELIKYIPKEIKTVGVFVNENLAVVEDKINQHQLAAVQLHGSETVAYVSKLKAKFENLLVIKAFGMDSNFDFSQLAAYQQAVDYFLFDTKTAAHGGSGKTFDWQVLGNYSLKKPYFLSGGIDLIHADALKSIDDECLYALDINSRFEVEPGLKEVKKVENFIAEIRKN